jgi:UPF0755 protein
MYSFTVSSGALSFEVYQALVTDGFGENIDTWLSLERTMDRQPFAWWNQITETDRRGFLTEGYLMPGTYTWPEDATPTEILTILLQGWTSELDAETQQAIEASTYSPDELLTMASIVEWEARYATEAEDASVRAQIAAVILNRLRQDMPLQMDTSQFYLDAIEEANLPDISIDADAYDTYRCEALPLGPIANPSLASLLAVLYPADTDALFFVYRIQTGDYYFAATYEEHLQNIEKAGLS